MSTLELEISLQDKDKDKAKEKSLSEYSFLKPPSLSAEVKLTEEELQKRNKEARDKDVLGGIIFSEIDKIPLPKLFRKKMSKTDFAFERWTGFFTKEQIKDIYEAIERDPSITKIRRVQTGKPGEKRKREENFFSDRFTELEKKLNLEFSVIVVNLDNTRQPIALFRGKSQELFSDDEDEDESEKKGKEENGYFVAKGRGSRIKFGQRLSDGKWVVVKIREYDVKELNHEKERLKHRENEYFDASRRLQEQSKNGSARFGFDLTSRVNTLKSQVLEKQKQIEELEKALKRRTKREGEFLAKAELHLGGTERTSGKVAKIYNAQVLLEGEEFFRHIADASAKTFISDVNERLEAFMLALADLKKLHDKGIIHGDIKSENMIYLCDASPRQMKIIDFDSSVQLNPGEQTARAITGGTPAYRAPEIKGETLLHKGSDIYSMGKILEIILNDHRYFLGINRHPELKSEIHLLIKKMTIVNYNDRPNIDAVIKEMQEIIHRHQHRATLSLPKP